MAAARRRPGATMAPPATALRVEPFQTTVISRCKDAHWHYMPRYLDLGRSVLAASALKSTVYSVLVLDNKL